MTGTWIIVDHGLCDECGACVAVCHKDALSVDDKLRISTDRCVNCGVCVDVCPFGALMTGALLDKYER